MHDEWRGADDVSHETSRDLRTGYSRPSLKTVLSSFARYCILQLFGNACLHAYGLVPAIARSEWTVII